MYGGVRGCVCLGELLRSSVAEVPQGELLEPFHRILVVRNGPLRIAGDWLVDPLHPFQSSRQNQRIRGVVP